MPKHTITPEMRELLVEELARSRDSRAVTDELIQTVKDSSYIAVVRRSYKSLFDTVRWALIWMCDRDNCVTRPFGKLDSDSGAERRAWIRTARPGHALSQQVWEITDVGRARLAPR
jgi:hypothetical protein